MTKLRKRGDNMRKKLSKASPKERVVIFVYAPKVCGDSLSVQLGRDTRACGKRIQEAHYIIDGVYAYCRSCMMKGLVKEDALNMAGRTHLT